VNRPLQGRFPSTSFDTGLRRAITYEDSSVFHHRHTTAVSFTCRGLLLRIHEQVERARHFKTIGIQQRYTRSNFKQVTDDLSLAKAAEMLEKQ
jgi:hypothetical protein